MALLAMALGLGGLGMRAARAESASPQPAETAALAGQLQGVLEGLACGRPQPVLSPPDRQGGPNAERPAGPCKVSLRLAGGERVALSAEGAENRQALAQARLGDVIKANVAGGYPPERITRVLGVGRPVPARTRLLAMGGTLLVLLLMALAVAKGQPLCFVIGKDGRYSNSLLQIVLWFAVLATVYGATLILRYCLLDPPLIGGVNIPENLLALSGLSALSFGGAKMITASKVDANPQGKTQASRAMLANLVTNDHLECDFGDLQMLLITLAAVVIYGLTGYHFLAALPVETSISLPDVDSTLLAGFGLGQGAYLLKKGASKAGQG